MNEGQEVQDNQIKQKYDALFDKDEYGNAPDENTFLERLIALECSGKKRLFRTLLKTKSNQEVREYLKSKGRDEWEKIISKEYLGKKMTIVDVINNYSKEIKKAFKEKSVKQALEELGIKCRKIDGMILPPEGNQRILPGNNELSNEEKEDSEMKFKRFQEKINIFFGDVLTVENEIFPGDFEVIVGENENDALRFKSYIAVWIKKLNKTIFINDRAGESTFVCDAIVSEEDMKSKSKKKMKEYLGDAFHNVSYSENQKEKWKLNMIDLICGPEKGTQKFIRDELMNENGELTEKGKERFKLNTVSRRGFKLLNGMGYFAIAGDFGVKREKKGNLLKDDAFYELSVAIFGEDNENVKNLAKSQEAIQKEIGREIIQREDERFKLKTTDLRSKFKLSNGFGYVKLAGIFGVKRNTPYDLCKDDAFYVLSVAIFGKDDENVKKIKQEIESKNLGLEQIKKELLEREEERFNLKSTDLRPKFKLSNGFGYIKLAGIFGVKRANKDYLQQDDAFYELSVAIFGEDHPKVIELKKRLIFPEEIKKGLIKRENERFNLKTTTLRSKFKLSNGIGYEKLIGIFLGKKGRSFRNYLGDGVFYKLSLAIFGEDNENVKKLKGEIENKNRGLEEIRKELIERENERFKLNVEYRPKFKLSNGFGYIKIAGTFGVKRANKDYLQQDDAFYELSAAIFGEDNENVKKLKQKIESKNRGLEEIRKELLEREDERFNLKITTIRSPFKLSNGFGYTKLAGIFGVKRGIPNDLIKDDAFYELSAAIFGENHPKVIELKKLLMSPEEIRKELLEREDERFNLKTTKPRSLFKLSNGFGYAKLAGIFGIKRSNLNELRQDDTFYELSAAIFGEDNDNVKKLKQKIESKNRGLKEIRKELLEREDERFNLKTTTVRSPFKLSNGFGYTKLAGIFGVKRGIPNDLIKDDAFYELSAAIFGKDHPKVIELKKLLMSPEEIRKELLEREDERFKLKINEDCRKFKLSNGMGYVAIARLFGLQGPEHDLFKNNKYYELSAAIFGENHPKVIELKKRLKL